MRNLKFLFLYITCVYAQDFPYIQGQYTQVTYQKPREYDPTVPVYPHSQHRPYQYSPPQTQPESSGYIQNIQFGQQTQQPQRYQPQNYQPQNYQPQNHQIQSSPPRRQPETRIKDPQDNQYSSVKGTGNRDDVSNRFLAPQASGNPSTPEDNSNPQPSIEDKPTDSFIPDVPAISLGNKFGDKYDEALEAIMAVAIRLEALLSETELKHSKNFLVSPLSMAVAVGELMLGARNPFKNYLHDLMVLKNPNETYSSSVRHQLDEKSKDLDYRQLHEQLGLLMTNLQHEGEQTDSYKLRTSSIIYSQSGIRIKPKYAQEVKTYYGTDIQSLDFRGDPIGSKNTINQWIRKSTNNLITELLGGPLPRNTHAILANAVYFKADWEVPFASEINRNGVFKMSPTETVNVTYMIGEFENYQFVESKKIGCRMVKIPYINKEVSMYILMPLPNNGNEYDINGFVQNLHMRHFDELTDSVDDRKVTMVLPKMSLSNIISMIEPLKRYHVYKNMEAIKKASSGTSYTKGRNTNPIDTTEDYVRKYQNTSTNIRQSQELKIDLGDLFEDGRYTLNNIYQQMTLTVNEKGTEAAAISAGIVDYIMDSVVFRVDRPFLFFIRHESTKALLFWGTVVDPTEARAF